MTPDELAMARRLGDLGTRMGAGNVYKLLNKAMQEIDTLNETIAALRAGQGTPTGDTR